MYYESTAELLHPKLEAALGAHCAIDDADDLLDEIVKDPLVARKLLLFLAGAVGVDHECGSRVSTHEGTVRLIVNFPEGGSTQ